MHSRSRSDRAFHTPQFSPWFIAAPFLIIALAGVLVTGAAGYTLAQTGRWTPPKAWDGIEVHMALLPGHGPYHSEVMWWTGTDDETGDFIGGLWGWKPGEYYCTGFPDTFNLAPISLLPPDDTHLFCAGATQLVDGKLFTAGGTQGGTEFGIRQAYTFDPFTNNWTQVDSMSQARWYPTATTLASGKVLVSSGSHHPHLEFFGGLRDGAADPADRALFLYGIGENGLADLPVRASLSPSSPDWPTPRTQHTAVDYIRTTFMFGGRDSDGTYLDQYWQLRRAPNELGSDYDYQWQFLNITGSKPAARRNHCAIATDSPLAPMIIFGGVAKIAGNDVTMSDVWRLRFVGTPVNAWKWSEVNTSGSSESPGARCGQAAIWSPSHHSMLMYGGRSSATGSPTDTTLWRLEFDDTFESATWESVSVAGLSPVPRFDHAMVHDPRWRVPDAARQPTDTTVAFLFGGDLGGTKSDELWQLQLTPAFAWRKLGLGGSAPSARSGHTLTPEGGDHLLYLFGGSPTDSAVYIAHIDSLKVGELRQWSAYRANAAALTGHTAIFGSPIYARVPEVWDPAAPADSEWTRLDDAPHLQQWFPQAFSSGSDEVFYAGPDLNSYKLTLSTQQWTQFPEVEPPATNTGFIGGSAVMYRPGKVMKCGTRDTQVLTFAVGTTKHIDLMPRQLGDVGQLRKSDDPARQSQSGDAPHRQGAGGGWQRLR